MSGEEATEPASVMGVLAADHQTRGDRPTYWPARVVLDDDQVRRFQPLAWNGSSDLRALGQADGLLFFNANTVDHRAGERAKFLPF
jgi:molybdopterin molybdotransferase